MSRIREKFGELKRSGRGGFIPFITAGDPDLATTERLLIELATLSVGLLHKQMTPAIGATILLVVGIASIAAATVLSFLDLRRI